VSDFSRFARSLSFRSHKTGPGETLLLCDESAPLLMRNGMSNFEAIWSFACGKVVKRKGERSVMRLRLGSKDDPVAVCYLKRHRQRLTLWTAFRSLLQPGICPGEGVKEFVFYRRFRESGLATAEPIAAGSRRNSFFCVDSFLLTRDYAPLICLEEVLLQRPDSLRGSGRQAKREAILRAVADYAARMHASGLNHQDFNATHILLDDPNATTPRVALFDLQRVDANRANRLRWPIKALAELGFTLPPDIFSENDRLFLLGAYRGSHALSLSGQIQYRLIKRKEAKIAAHTRRRGLAPKMTYGNG